MLLWLIFAVLTGAVLAAVLAPLMRPARPEAAAGAGALAVYRHQLEEIEAERARGLIGEAEADAARLEISRRLLASAARDGDGPRSGPTPTRGAHVALAAAALVPLLTLAVYLAHGSPGLPSQPLAGRAQDVVERAQVGELIARVEARLREHPEDGDGWDVIAPVYFKLGRFQDAADAFTRALALKGETVRRLAGFAEANVLAADSIVTEPARLAYEKILKLEPGRVEARFWLALAKEQDGRLAPALAEFQALLAEAPADASWRGMVEARVSELARRLAASGSNSAPRGPSASDVAAADRLSPGERTQMIAGMVDGLAQRLERDGRDLAGWQRLVNAYVVLGRTDDAHKALAAARRTFSADAKALGELAALAKSLGLGS